MEPNGAEMDRNQAFRGGTGGGFVGVGGWGGCKGKRNHYSTVSNTDLSEFFFRLTEFRGGNSVSSFQPIIRVQKRTHRVRHRTQ